jgi:uracil-DNA glycosylase
LLEQDAPIGKNRGRILAGAQAKHPVEADLLVTVHPSFLLRVLDEDRDAAYEASVADLKLIAPYAS